MPQEHKTQNGASRLLARNSTVINEACLLLPHNSAVLIVRLGADERRRHIGREAPSVVASLRLTAGATGDSDAQRPCRWMEPGDANPL